MLSHHTRYFYVIQCPNSIIFLKFSVLPENRKRGCMLRGSHGERIALFFLLLNRITRATTCAKRERKKEREPYFAFSGQKEQILVYLNFIVFRHTWTLCLCHIFNPLFFIFSYFLPSLFLPLFYMYIFLFSLFLSYLFFVIYSYMNLK